MELKETELKDDIAELNLFLQGSKRPVVQALLKKEIQRIDAELKLLAVSVPVKQEVTALVEEGKKGEADIEYKTVVQFGWEQEGSQVKVYLSEHMDGVGTLPKENINCSFLKNSFDLKILGAKKGNYRLKIPILNAEINPAKSKIRVKSNSITIALWKKESGQWSDLKEKKSPIGKTPEKGVDKEDPQASIMNMMKNMYDEGDDNMKRMIAESMYKAQNKQPGAADTDDLKL